MTTIRRSQIQLLPAEKGQASTQNHCTETEICKIKDQTKTRMREHQEPTRLWDFGLVYITDVQSIILAQGPDQQYLNGLILTSTIAYGIVTNPKLT